MSALIDTPFSEAEVEQFYAYAFAQYESGNWNEAADVFRVLCTRRPFESRFWFGLGATLQEAESYRDALQAWAMAALLNEKDPFPHFHAAECYFSMQDAEEAGKALFQAQRRMDPDHPLGPKVKLLQEQWMV